MKLSQSLVSIGEGTFKGAFESDNIIKFYLDIDGAIAEKKIARENTKSISTTIVSYADNYVKTDRYEFSLYGTTYEANKLT